MRSHRVRYAALAIFTEFILGVLYTWSVFRGPLAKLHGWSEAQTVAPYRYSILTFAIAMIFAGIWQDRKGPRIVGTVSGILLSLGCVLSGIFSGSVTGLILSYGLLCGFGVGFGYVPPIATCIKWFPDRRGMIVGISVMGAGFGPLLYGPVIERLIGKDPAAWQTTIPRTFFILAGLFAVCVIGAAQFMKLPPPGWKPPGWTPPVERIATIDVTPMTMIRTWQFYALWAFDFLGSSVGLVAIGAAAPLIQEGLARERRRVFGRNRGRRNERVQWQRAADLGNHLRSLRTKSGDARSDFPGRDRLLHVFPSAVRFLAGHHRVVSRGRWLWWCGGADARAGGRLLWSPQPRRQLRHSLLGVGALRLLDARLFRRHPGSIPDKSKPRPRPAGRVSSSVFSLGRDGGASLFCWRPSFANRSWHNCAELY